MHRVPTFGRKPPEKKLQPPEGNCELATFELVTLERFRKFQDSSPASGPDLWRGALELLKGIDSKSPFADIVRKDEVGAQWVTEAAVYDSFAA